MKKENVVYSSYWRLLVVSLLLLSSCKTEEKKVNISRFRYEEFKDSVIQNEKENKAEPVNMFDAPVFTPGSDSLDKLLVKIDTILYREAALMMQLDTMKKRMKNVAGFSEEEKVVIRENIRMVDSFLRTKKDTASKTTCEEKNCIVFAEIDKSRQILYLYLFGELKDSFMVSTGKSGKYETPVMSLHPQGPLLIKYTSRKFPGGNYKGLGNMPYAVFIKGGYAIHGTTPGNYAKLGSKASHGCIRLYPDNAKIFHALIKTVGLQQTWIVIRDSLPGIPRLDK